MLRRGRSCSIADAMDVDEAANLKCATERRRGRREVAIMRWSALEGAQEIGGGEALLPLLVN
jgi:hypothetical protein